MQRFCCLFVLLLCFLPSQAQFFLTPEVDSIPMRDGKVLAADIYLPDTNNAYPVILVQTPYNRLATRLGLPLGIGMALDSSKYAFVTVDWRGFFGSFAAFSLNPNRGEDGYDVVEWINTQPWCNGKIGGWGPSALGNIQYLTAREQPPALDCIVPLVAEPQFNYDKYYPGGSAREEYINQLDNLGFGLGSLVYANPIFNIFWQFADTSTYYPDEITVPTMVIGGWYDHNIESNLEWFGDLQTQSPANVQAAHRMLIGPWAHGGFGAVQVGSATQGELSYPAAAGWSDSLALRFFDFHLRGLANGVDTDDAVQTFLMGSDRWESSSAWREGPQTARFFLNEQNSLTIPEPTANNGSDAIIYDPRYPSPTVGGPVLTDSLGQGPFDQAPVVEARTDILTYTTPALSDDLTVSGQIKAVLYVSSDQPDTDFTVRLTDVYPDGRSMLVNTGVMRMRFRNSFSQYFDTIIPGNIYPIEVVLPSTSITFLAGHSIRLNVASSNFPQFSLNLNNGDSLYVAGDTMVATNEVYRTISEASYLELPSVPEVGQEEISLQNSGLLLFPQPGNGQVKLLALGEVQGAVDIRIVDLQGRTILLRESVKGFELQRGIVFETSAWQSGIYLAKVSASFNNSRFKGNKVVKMLIQH